MCVCCFAPCELPHSESDLVHIIITIGPKQTFLTFYLSLSLFTLLGLMWCCSGSVRGVKRPQWLLWRGFGCGKVLCGTCLVLDIFHSLFFLCVCVSYFIVVHLPSPDEVLVGFFESTQIVHSLGIWCCVFMPKYALWLVGWGVICSFV